MKIFLVKHQLINTYQHGFLKARSRVTNILCLLEEITKWVDDGSPVDVQSNSYTRFGIFGMKALS